jgi:hypothetical protein
MTTQPESGKAFGQLLKGLMTLLIVGAVTSACVDGNPSTPTTTTTKSAATKQQEFFDSVKGQGVTGPTDEQLTLGQDVCAADRRGMDPGEIEQYLRTQAPITTHVAQVIRVAAELYLC